MCPKWTAVAGWLSILANQLYGTDTLGIPGRKRFHTDDSIQLKYLRQSEKTFRQGRHDPDRRPGIRIRRQQRRELYGGAQLLSRRSTSSASWPINASGSTRTCLPLRSAAARLTTRDATWSCCRRLMAQRQSPDHPISLRIQVKAWDASATFDYMPRQFITWRFEYNHRASSVPYFTGNGGITPPAAIRATRRQSSPVSFRISASERIGSRSPC